MTLKEKERMVTAQEKIWAREKQILEREYSLKKEKRDLRNSFREKIANSKLLVWFLFINCTIIELFTIWVTVKELHLAAQGAISPDLSPLLALISTVVAEVIGFGIYSLKSTKENTKGGIIYETAMREYNSGVEEENCG